MLWMLSWKTPEKSTINDSKLQILSSKTWRTITWSSIIIINITNLISGLKHHDNLLITMGAIGSALLLIAGIIKITHSWKARKKLDV